MASHQRRGVCGDAPRALTAERQRASTPRGSLTKAHRLLAVSAVGLAGVLLAACGSDDPATEARKAVERPNTVAVVGTDRLRFEPGELTILAGQRVTLELTAGSVEHDFVVEDAAQFGAAEAGHQADNPDDSDDLHVAHADEGETATATFTIDRAGTYTVYCSVPGHRDAGMVASLEVIEAEG